MPQSGQASERHDERVLLLFSDFMHFIDSGHGDLFYLCPFSPLHSHDFMTALPPFASYDAIH
jgi:hypothetical protein